MKVLMFGWEFPPHISGGLGTACFGITQGLVHHGVEVLFVVPRAYGDEDERFVSVVGANEVPALEFVESASASASEAAPKPAKRRVRREAGSKVSDEAWSRAFSIVELLAIESPLTPYLTELEYLERLTAIEESGSGRRVELLAALAELLQVPRGDSSGAETSRRLLARSPLPFSGGYGPDLMSEVARFALVAAQLGVQRSFDVVHAHDWMALPAGLAAARSAGKPLVFHVHACEYDRSGDHVNERVRDLEQLGLDAADRVVCVSHYTAGVLQRRYRIDPAKLRVVHNAVTQKEQVDILHVTRAIEEPIVLFLGRVTFQKGPDYFLEAAARVIHIEPRVKFVMSGSGDMLPVMIERAAKLGLARHVHFTGFLKGEDVERMYAMADIYVMPSVSEPFGITPLEAMALDTPVVLSRQSGVSEVLRNALKVDFWDVDDIANKILALLRYPALVEQLTSEGREEIQALRWEHPAALLRDVYRELVA
ncbi:MAG TPA: glycosyltransferase [Planctomycetota bacterium]|jgi:glycosyltransferase involved in cell wall biosynthesis|nr:glycosyltransferase [Planctomycetota bacterium]